MGKMPLASLIGACGLGMLLTGCNCCNNKQDHNSKASYMGGKADAHTDFTRPRSKNTSAPDLNSVSSPLDSTSSGGAGLTSGLPPSGQGMTGSGTMMPNNTASTPVSGSYPSLPSNSGSGIPLSANTTPGMGGSSSLTNNGAGALAASAYGGNPSASSPIQKVANVGDDSSTVKNAAYPADNNDTTASMPSSGAGRMPLPPPPPMNPYSPTNSASSGNSLSSISAAMPPPPPSDSTSPLNAPPPQVTSGTPSSLPGMGAPASTSPSRSSIGPAYLYSPVK